MTSRSKHLFNVQVHVTLVSVLGQIYVFLRSLRTTEPYQLEICCRQIISVLILTDSLF
jgi:hypothetical protein